MPAAVYTPTSSGSELQVLYGYNKRLNRWGSDDCGGPGNGGKLPGDVWNLASMKTPQPLRRTPPPAGRNWIDGRWVATGVAAYGWYRVLRAMNLGGGFGAAFGGGGPLYGGGGGRPAYDE